jgi:hypothetical protein
MPGHKIDDIGRDLLGGADQIAFIFAIFVVNDDYHAAVADLGDGFVNSRNRHEGMLTETTRPRKGAKGLKLRLVKAWPAGVRRTSRLRLLRD